MSGTSTTRRRTKAEIEAIRSAIVALPKRYKRMTVRGIFYVLASEGIVPKDDTTGYRPVQRQVLALRREEMLPWAFVADGTRWVRRANTFDSVDDALREISRTYRRDLWVSQSRRVEIWLEKDALADLIWPVAEAWDVSLLVSRGVSSETFIYDAAAAAREAKLRCGRTTTVFGLFDYDAGGERAWRQIQRGFAKYAPECVHGERLALTADQIAQWGVPTRPAKKRDPEASSWGAVAAELDAIHPDTLIALVESAVSGLVDPHAWRIQQDIEHEERAGLEALLGQR